MTNAEAFGNMAVEHLCPIPSDIGISLYGWAVVVAIVQQTLGFQR